MGLGACGLLLLLLLLLLPLLRPLGGDGDGLAVRIGEVDAKHDVLVAVQARGVRRDSRRRVQREG